MSPVVSVIVPTFNSSENMRTCLESLKAQTYPDIEVIVVDNHSEDKTREIVRRFGIEPLIAGPERSSQVNLGVKRARGKYVYRVDSDFFVSKNVIKESVEHCEK